MPGVFHSDFKPKTNSRLVATPMPRQKQRGQSHDTFVLQKRQIVVSAIAGFALTISIVSLLTQSGDDTHHIQQAETIELAESKIHALIESEQPTPQTTMASLSPKPTPTVEAPPSHVKRSVTPEKQPDKHISYQIDKGATLGHYFQEAGIGYQTLHHVLAKLPKTHAKRLQALRPGQQLQVILDSKGQLKKVELECNEREYLLITLNQANQAVQSEIVAKPVVTKETIAHGTIRTSLHQAGKEANLSDRLLMQLADIFAYEIDFSHDLRPGDHFSVIYETDYLEGKPSGGDRISAVRFTNRGKTHEAYFYNGKSQKGFYNAEGKSLRKAFTRTPVKYTRISSHFNLNRRHPVLHKIRAHKGVDYAAPTGTPVHATADGKVIFKGKRGGYGNAVELQHGRRYSTLYAHLSRFPKRLKNGDTVKQGQVIGYVGMTGLASGPHLHYEFRIDGVHKNPLTVTLPKAPGIDAANLSKFKQLAENRKSRLEQFEGTWLAKEAHQNASNS